MSVYVKCIDRAEVETRTKISRYTREMNADWIEWKSKTAARSGVNENFLLSFIVRQVDYEHDAIKKGFGADEMTKNYDEIMLT